VDAAYVRMDGHLGRLMDSLEEGDLLVVVSDHGWNFDGTNHWRMPDGVFALFGAGVVKGLAPARVHVYDVAPTVLRYLGLPLSRGFPGRALVEAFSPEVRASLPESYVASYGPRHQTLRVSDDLIDAAQKMQLDSMGYR
jgi:arylsulfatase A-like enzyme